MHDLMVLVVEIDDVDVVVVVFLVFDDSMVFVQIEHELFDVEYQLIQEDNFELYQHGMSKN